MSSRSTGRDAVARDAGLGFAGTPEVVMIQIFTQGGRSRESRQSLFTAIAGELVIPQK